MTTMTAQEIFDKVATHLLKQGKKSTNDSGVCRYRSLDGSAKCAIGCLIPDDEYSTDMEGKPVRILIYLDISPSLRALAGWYAHDIEKVSDWHVDLLEELQAIHDEDPPINWRKKLCSLAHDHGLDPSVLNEKASSP